MSSSLYAANCSISVSYWLPSDWKQQYNKWNKTFAMYCVTAVIMAFMNASLFANTPCCDCTYEWMYLYNYLPLLTTFLILIFARVLSVCSAAICRWSWIRKLPVVSAPLGRYVKPRCPSNSQYIYNKIYVGLHPVITGSFGILKETKPVIKLTVQLQQDLCRVTSSYHRLIWYT